MGLLPDSARVTGSVRYRGMEMIGASRSTLRGVRGNNVSFVFQEPMTSLNPLHTLEKQIGESLAIHRGLAGKLRGHAPLSFWRGSASRSRNAVSRTIRTSSPVGSGSG